MLQIDLKNVKCALFDLDGVVFDTEPQYTEYWATECRRYHPEQPGLEQRIKGMSLTEIYLRYFSEVRDEWNDMTERLNSWESRMRYDYIPGFEAFIQVLKTSGVKTAVVTSSNRKKMENVYRQHPSFIAVFDEIMTAEDFSRSKPDPDCYQKAMARFGCSPSEAVVFEDSVNGLKSGRASGAYVVGLATTNPEDVVKEYSDIVVKNYL